MSNLDVVPPNRAERRRAASNRFEYEIKPLRYTTHSRAAIMELVDSLLPTPGVPLAIEENEAEDQSASKAVH